MLVELPMQAVWSPDAHELKLLWKIVCPKLVATKEMANKKVKSFFIIVDF